MLIEQLNNKFFKKQTMYGRKLTKKEVAERHLRHCKEQVRRNPKNGYWKSQMKKTKKFLGV